MGNLVTLVFVFNFFNSFTQENKLIWVKGGKTIVGNKEQADAQPLFSVKITGFWMQEHEVTNSEFAVFVDQTGYTTLAERNGGSFVFANSLENDTIYNDAPWWKFRSGVNWKNPIDTLNIENLKNHPVVHIAFEDACAYCEWLGMRLPTEIEREYVTFKNEEEQMNIWQGKFPETNDTLDGFFGTAPVGSYAPGKLGFVDLQGNVWEWCQDPYHENAYNFAEKWGVLNSSVPLVPEYYDVFSPDEETRVIRGGSFLCAENYCIGYQSNVRMRSSVKRTFSHIGFRCVK